MSGYGLPPEPGSEPDLEHGLPGPGVPFPGEQDEHPEDLDHADYSDDDR